MKYNTITTMFLATATFLQTVTMAQSDQVTITDLDWDAARVISSVLSQTIEDRYQIDVVIREGDTSQ